MLNFFQGWRERGWNVIDAGTYADAWQRFGGSVATHPVVVERLAHLARIPVRYLAWGAGRRIESRDPDVGPRLGLVQGRAQASRQKKACSIWAMQRSFCPRQRMPTCLCAIVVATFRCSMKGVSARDRANRTVGYGPHA